MDRKTCTIHQTYLNHHLLKHEHRQKGHSFRVVSIHVVPPTESDLRHLVAVSNAGTRYTFSLFQKAFGDSLNVIVRMCAFLERCPPKHRNDNPLIRTTNTHITPPSNPPSNPPSDPPTGFRFYFATSLGPSVRATASQRPDRLELIDVRYPPKASETSMLCVCRRSCVCVCLSAALPGCMYPPSLSLASVWVVTSHVDIDPIIFKVRLTQLSRVHAHSQKQPGVWDALLNGTGGNGNGNGGGGQQRESEAREKYEPGFVPNNSPLTYYQARDLGGFVWNGAPFLFSSHTCS